MKACPTLSNTSLPAPFLVTLALKTFTITVFTCPNVNGERGSADRLARPSDDDADPTADRVVKAINDGL